MEFLIYEYKNDRYSFVEEITEQNQLERTHTGKIFPDYSTLELKLKPHYNKYIKKDIRGLTPLLLVCEHSGEVLFTYFVIHREEVRTKQEHYVYFNCVDFDYFKAWKIVSSNVSYTSVEDKTQPPEDFGKYKYNTTVKKHLTFCYEKCFLNPPMISYGESYSYPMDYRRFKGLNSVTLDFDDTSSFNINKNLMLFMSTFSELETSLYIQDKPLITVCNLDKKTGLLNVVVREPRILDTHLLNSYTQIVEEITVLKPTINCHFAYAYPFNYYNMYDIASIDFTSLETVHDLNFICQDNPTYLQNTLETYFEEAQLKRIEEYIKINVMGAFQIFYHGDILDINGSTYILQTLQETRDLNSINIDVKIVKY